MDNLKLNNISKRVKLKVLELAASNGKGHLGGTFSCLDLLVALYYDNHLRIDSQNSSWEIRDRFILSKGHACLALYIILEELGFISSDQLNSYGQDGGLGAQLDISVKGVDWNTGSLGHALGVACGMAMASKIDNKNFFAWTVLGDAEMSEGSVWEAICYAGDKKLNNLVCIVDRNRLSVTETLDNDGIFRNFESTLNNLGWNSVEINGHNLNEISIAFQNARISERPTMILANTIKGKGVSFMENNLKWHHGVPTATELEIARLELSQ
jgi:transketolase